MKGKSKEEAKKEYVGAFLEVRVFGMTTYIYRCLSLLRVCILFRLT